MTAQELTTWQLGHVTNQVKAALDGLTDNGWDHRSSPSAMSPREIVEHLCESATAFNKSCQGVEHEWGTFSIEDKSPSNLLSEFAKVRSQATENAANGDDKRLREAFLYVSEHDAYHIGQLCTARLDLDPNWNPYSIYEES